MSTLKVNTIDSHSGSTINIDSTADVSVDSATSATSSTTGALKVTGGISTQENLYVGGNAVITGTMTANGGTITLGDAGTDNVTIGGEINSDVIPDVTNTYDLGSSSKKWAEVHATTVTGNLTGDVTGNVTATTLSGALTGNVTGNADTATTLAATKTIGGVAFDGSANINLAGVNTAGNQDTSGNATTATTLATARTLALSGDVSGSVSFDGSANATITATIADDSHNHTTANVDGLDTALGLKAPLASPALTGVPTAPTAAANTNTTQVATTAYVQTEVTDLIGGAPGTLDTLNELAAAINDDASYASTLTTALATKTAKTSNQSLSTAANAMTISGNTITLARGDSTTDTVTVPEYDSTDIDAAVSLNTAKETNVTTNLSTTTTSTTNTVVSSDGTNAILPAATTSVAGMQTAADKTKLDGIEALADVTDVTNVTAAGALMDSEVTNLAAVKAFATTDYATAAQGTTANAALPKAGGAMTGAITTTSTFDGRDVATDGTKLDTIATSANNYSHPANHAISVTTGLQAALDSKAPLASPALTGAPTAPTAAANTNTTQVATTAYVQTELTDLIGGAPGTLDTLNELAAAINDDSDYSSTLTTALATKTAKTSNQSLSTAANAMTISGHTITLNRGDGTTDTVTVPDNNTTYSVGDGGLTQVNFTTADNTKLDGIEASADVTDTTNVVAALTAGTNVAISAGGTISSTDTNTTYSVGDGGLTQVNFTTADNTKLDGIEASADVTDTTNVVAALTAGTNVAISAGGTISSTDTNTTYSVGDGGLTQVNFTTADNTKLDGIATSANNYSLPVSAPTVLGGVKEGGDISIDAVGVMTVNDDSHNHTVANVDGLQTALDAKTTPGYVDTQITNLIGGAPGTLDTLNELAAAINDDAAYASTLTTALGTKTAKTSNQSLSTAANAMTISGHTITLNRGDGTTDTVTVPDNNTTYSVGDGGLTQVNFTTADNTKLDGIEASADVTDTTNVVAALTAGTNVAISAGGTISSTDTNTTYSVGDSGLTQKNFTTTLKSKLDGIESGATANQTNEEIQDIAGAMWSSNSESGVTVTYQDADGTMDINVNDPTVSLTGAVTGSATMTNLGNISITTTATNDPTITLGGDLSGSCTLTNLGNATLTATIADDSHNHVTGNIDGLAEYISDTAGAMWSSNSESGVTVTYQDTDNTMDINVNDPTITLSGDLSGSATMTNLGNVTISAVVADDSHNHTTANVDGLDTALGLKAPLASPALTGVPTAPTAAANTNTTQVATTAYVQTEVTDLIGGAPGTLDTLNELAAAINDDASYASTLTTALATKTAKTSNQSLSTAANAMTISGHTITLNRGDGTTDTVTVPDNNTTYSVGDGGLTQKNFTTADNTKLDGIATSANNYSHPTSAGNKHIPTAGASGQFLKYSASGTAVWASDNNTTYSVGDNGLTAKNFTSTLKSKLDGIETGATADQTAAQIKTLLENGIDSVHYVDGSIDAIHIASGTITATQLAANCVDSSELVNGSIDNGHLATDCVNGAKIANDSINSEHYVAGSIDNEHIADNAINSEHYADNSIDALHLNVSGNGTTSQYLRSDGDGTMSWVTPPDTNTDTNTTYSADGNYGMTLSGTAFRLEDDRRRNSTTTDIYSGNTHDYTFYDASHGIRWYTAGAEEMRLEDDGDLHVDGQVVAYSGTVSDERLKTGVSNVTGALDKVAQLNGVEFTYKKDGRRSAGVIAQDVEKVLPSAVTEKEMPFEEGSEKYKVVEYDALHALLIEAVKELRDEVNILKGEK